VTAALLVFAWGNPSRGDDALGPLFAERLQAELEHHEDVEILVDFQLQVEHALDLVGRQRVLFVDASLTAQGPFEVTALQARHDDSFTTHALSPQAVLQVYQQLHSTSPPACTLLAIRGERFELGESPSAPALAHLDAALAWARAWLREAVPHAEA
jgi:hydrogenase maturation protease